MSSPCDVALDSNKITKYLFAGGVIVTSLWVVVIKLKVPMTITIMRLILTGTWVVILLSPIIALYILLLRASIELIIESLVASASPNVIMVLGLPFFPRYTLNPREERRICSRYISRLKDKR
uniref:Uncharacterized protein n=1 Tax=Glossina austeni TaxID=7395 RepID=A0A1A9VHR7_GLOAU